MQRLILTLKSVAVPEHLPHNQYSVTAAINRNGTVDERYAYSPYGETTVLNSGYVQNNNNLSTIDNEYTYTGRRLDPSGLMYFRARYYDPQTGQFISRDPLGYVDGMSQYRAYFVPAAMDPSGSEIYTGAYDEKGRKIFSSGVNCYVKIYKKEWHWHGVKWVQVGSELVTCPIDTPDGPVTIPDISIEDLVDIIDEVKNPSKPPRWPGPSITDIGTGVVKDYLNATGELASPRCKGWFKHVNEVMQEAANGDCTRCPTIETSQDGKLCIQKIVSEMSGVAAARAQTDWDAAVNSMAKACSETCCNNK